MLSLRTTPCVSAAKLRYNRRNPLEGRPFTATRPERIMTPERWHKVTAMFHAALEQPSSALEEFLRRECGDDAQLYGDVRGMVEQHARSGILDHAPVEPAGAQAVFAAGEMVSGRYCILRFLGRGGMGEVYEAEDLDLRERVALKTLLPEIAGDGR